MLPSLNTPPSDSDRTPEGWFPCPSCQGTSATMPGFTWWGGLIGSKLLTHVVCNQCQTGYSGKTGASNTGKIAAYMIITGVIVGAILLSLR